MRLLCHSIEQFGRIVVGVQVVDGERALVAHLQLEWHPIAVSEPRSGSRDWRTRKLADAGAFTAAVSAVSREG